MELENIKCTFPLKKHGKLCKNDAIALYELQPQKVAVCNAHEMYLGPVWQIVNRKDDTICFICDEKITTAPYRWADDDNPENFITVQWMNSRATSDVHYKCWEREK